MDFSKYVSSIGKLEEVDVSLSNQLKNYLYPIIGCCQEVHKEMGPFLNEYMYQDALNICLEEHGYTGENLKKEYSFTSMFHNKVIQHTHKVDFLINNKVFIECKAIERLGAEQRQQLWNYMRLSGIKIGILYNFAPIKDQVEKYYLDTEKQKIYMF